ncbi:MAG: hypothetical protein DWQ34_00340 [Planctomycetota bacterium]|nr:MAG: hypothetical protein DWQ29_04640 [Planctomycetota bacterium]REJ98469.1 MAG: hypothetical protein DWQ34_00340 [Planctomycetota bacterium]REK23616.1 MAG: hypothetical protein DWQ41_16385 [Planctomycetota bacterium]REK31157.1 MAG: hypothetical protein DWQ45_20145 [Planctomycetota bacterium]
MWYDIVVLAVLAYTTIRGASKGAVWQLAAIAGVVLCFVFAESISAAAGPYVKLEPPMNNWVVMIGAYLVFTFISFGVARLLTDWIEKVKFGEFNRHLGALLGFVKGVALCLVATFFIVTVSDGAREMLRHSHSGYAAAVIMDRLHPVMPEKIRDALDKYIHQLDSPDMPLKYADHEHAHSDDDHGEAHGFDENSVLLPSEFDDLMSRVPADVRDDFQSVLLRTLEQTEPESRPDLLERLMQVLDSADQPEDVTSLRNLLDQPPEHLLGAISNWLMRRPGEQGAEPPVPDRREALLQEIAGSFSSYPKAQEMIRGDIEQQLANVPPEIALLVLEDYRADLMGDPRDPDPSTTLATPLQDRIVRQLSRRDEQPLGEIR